MAQTNDTDEWLVAGKATTWDYKTQKEITGTYIEKKDNIGPNGSMMYDLKTKDGVMSVWGSALLDDRFKGISIGEEVKIIYHGKETSPKTKRSFHNFEVFHREPRVEF